MVDTPLMIPCHTLITSRKGIFPRGQPPMFPGMVQVRLQTGAFPWACSMSSWHWSFRHSTADGLFVFVSFHSLRSIPRFAMRACGIYLFCASLNPSIQETLGHDSRGGLRHV